jgi:hypothetical protein
MESQYTYNVRRKRTSSQIEYNGKTVVFITVASRTRLQKAFLLLFFYQITTLPLSPNNNYEKPVVML